MIVFHELVYDAAIAGLTGIYGNLLSLPRLNAQLGRVDMLHVSGYAAQVSGSSPTLTISVYGSGDGYNWLPEGGGLSTGLSTTQETFFQGISKSVSAFPCSPYRRLLIQVSGGSGAFVGCLKVWVTARDSSLRISNVT